MMTDEVSRIQQTQIHTQQIASQASLAGISQEESEEDFQQWVDEGSFNISVMARKFEQLETKTRRQTRKDDAEKAEKKEEGEAFQVNRLEEISDQFERKNP